LQRGEGGAAIGRRVDANAEPRHAIAAKNAQNWNWPGSPSPLAPTRCLQQLEIINHADGDEKPERREKFSLLQQVGLARLPDDVGNVAHALWTGSARVCLYSKMPNAAPTKHRSPGQIQQYHGRSPSRQKGNVRNDGRLMSASPAKALRCGKTPWRKKSGHEKVFGNSS
jgi:hypothetical protein